MTGFTNLIYFKDKPTSTEIKKIKNLLESRGKVQSDSEYEFICSFDVTTNDNSKFGVRIYSSDTEVEEFDEENKSEFIATLEYVPKFYIGIMGINNISAAQTFISKFMLEIMQIKDGMVDLSAIIDIGLTRDIQKIREFVSSIKGNVKELYYSDVNKNRWFTHLIDREFLYNWTKHPQFYIPV